MAANPRLEINVGKIAGNTAQVAQKAGANGVNIVGVTKVCCGAPEVARAVKQGGAAMLGDSRLENIARMKEAGIPGPYMLIRIPMQSAAAETVRLADYCLLSDVVTGRILGAEARRQGKTMHVVIMVDVGDLREGFWPNQIPGAVTELAAVEGLAIAGLGVNLTCYGAISPDENNLGLLISLAEEIRKNNKLELPIISGGNSSSLGMLWEGKLPGGINQLRIGEGIMLGCETLERAPLPGLHTDVFTAVAEIVEVREKPSLPIGRIAQDVFGNVPVFEDRGIHQRAILALGRQDVIFDGLQPLDAGVEILGGSSDHLLVEISGRKAAVGEELRFRPDYGAVLTLNTSPYVQKVYFS